MPEPWSFGVAPLGQTRRLAPLLRNVAGLALSLELDDPVVDRLEHELRRAEGRLTGRAAAGGGPRVGPDADADRRVYLDHSRDIGAYNPCFPEYLMDVTGPEARGTVTFPIVFEGPPGVVHGGFLAVFFDCVIQHHNCDAGQAGKTVSLNVEYIRPAPLMTPLEFEVERTAAARRISSEARLFRDGEILCRARMQAVAGDRTALPHVSPRRDPGPISLDDREEPPEP